MAVSSCGEGSATRQRARARGPVVVRGTLPSGRHANSKMGLPPRERDRGVPGPSEGGGQRILTHYALPRVDEIGYLPVIRSGGTLFLQRINAVHERASTVLASNKGFEEWGAMLAMR